MANYFKMNGETLGIIEHEHYNTQIKKQITYLFLTPMIAYMEILNFQNLVYLIKKCIT